MIGKLLTYALDCPDPTALAGFYAELLGGKVVDEIGRASCRERVFLSV